MRKPLMLVAALAGFSGLANAHQIWIEQDGQSAVIRFGEFGDNLRETSPGLLDKFGKPVATLLSASAEKPADGVRRADGFALPFKAAKGESIVAEDPSYPLYSYKTKDGEVHGWYHPAARFVTSFAKLAPRLTLDLVPAGKPGAFQLFHKGQPKAGAKVMLVTQSGWAREAHTDEAGMVSFDMPWQGTYVAEASFDDRSAGERDGGKYDVINYVTTLTYTKADGLKALPAGPQAVPGK